MKGRKKLVSCAFAAAICMLLNGTALATENMNKGLLCQDYFMLDDAVELGTDEIIYGITTSAWLTQKQGVSTFIKSAADRGMDVTAVLLNDNQSIRPEMMPQNPELGSHYFMFNVYDESGRSAVTDYVTDVAESLRGKVDRYIIGNEIQDQIWNYLGPMDMDSYAAKYAETFTVCYNAIKAVSPEAEVYIPFDYGWCNESNGSTKYNGKGLLDRLSVLLPKEMDWGVAWHAYPDPLTSPVFWDDAPTAGNDPNSYIVNFNNLHVLTDYMQTAPLLRADGSVRNIILSEQGFSSVSGGVSDESMQAAAYAYGYFIAKQNPYIKAYLLNRQVDAKSEVAQGRAFGIWNCDMTAAENEKASSKKYIWSVFRDIDREGENQYIKELVKEKTGASV